MWLYLIIFLVPVFAFLSSNVRYQHSEKFLKFCFIFLACFVGFSDMFGGFDRYIYGELFDDFADSLRADKNIKDTWLYGYYGTEWGYLLLNWVTALVTRNRYIFITIITFIIYYNYYIAFKRHITNYPFALVMFLTFTFYFTFTYLRQMIGVSVALLAIKYLIHQDRRKYFVMMLVVLLMHKSGIIFAAMYFVPNKLYAPKRVISFLAICLLIGVSGITSNAYDAYEMVSGMEGMYGTNDYNAGGEARIAYLIEALFFAGFILWKYNNIEPTRENIIFTNMAFLFCGSLLMFVRSLDGGRVAWYFIFGVFYIITYLVTKRTSDKEIKPLSIAMYKRKPVSTYVYGILTIFLILYFRVFFAWQVVMNLYPYKTYFTNGHRLGDPVYDQYEYDANYDNDKFYRLWSWE